MAFLKVEWVSFFGIKQGLKDASNAVMIKWVGIVVMFFRL